MRRHGILGIALFAWALGGCGTNIFTDFPNRLIGADGQTFVLEDIQAVVDDPDLGGDEKRQALRDMGIEDEKLIDALLTL